MRAKCVLMARMHLKTLLLPLLVWPAVASAQDANLGWSFSGQLTGVWAAGNSESSTFGLGTTLRHRGTNGEVKFEAGGIRTDASKTTRRAVGTPDNYTIEETSIRTKTAENYYGRIRYDRRLENQFVVFVGVDVLRNTFAGIDSRTLLATGAGRVWVDNDHTRFKTDAGVTYTFQQDVVANPFLKSTFPGTRLTMEMRQKVTQTSRWESVLLGDLNFSDTDDVRFDFTNAFPVSVNSVISLKPSLQLIWRNQPALREIELFTEEGESTGEKIVQPLEKLDSFFTLALVVTV